MCPALMREAVCVPPSSESCDTGPARGTQSPLWGQEGGRRGRPAQLSGLGRLPLPTARPRRCFIPDVGLSPSLVTEIRAL